MFQNRSSPRLGQWTGRRRSTRHEEPLLRRLAQPAVLLRLGIVWLTTIAVTVSAIRWGVPLPYRVGEIPQHDLRARVEFELVNHVELVNQLDPQKKPPIEPANVGDRPVLERYPRGMVLVPMGQPIGERQLELLEEEHLAYQSHLTPQDRFHRGVALFLIFSLLTTLVVLYVARFQQSLAQSLPMICGVSILVMITLVLAMWLSQAPWHAVFLPLTFTAMVLTLAYNPQFALLMSFSLSFTVAIVLGTQVEPLLVQTGGLAAAVLLLRHVRTRTQLVQVASYAGLAFAALT